MKAFKNGLKKAITFSYDDGILQDERLVSLFNKYQLKGTFNLNPNLLGELSGWMLEGHEIKRLSVHRAQQIYQGHEIANHAFDHPSLTSCTSEQKLHQIAMGKQQLEHYFNHDVKGMAYPFGDTDDEIIQIMKKQNILYGRLATSHHAFHLPEDVYRWSPTAHHNDPHIFDIIHKFLNEQNEEATLLYIWGHSYEFDIDNHWNHFERICQVLAFNPDVWYCTNLEIVHELTEIAHELPNDHFHPVL